MFKLVYRFSVNGRNVKAQYPESLAKDSQPESNEIFFRDKLSGKLSFIADDYDWLKSQNFDTIFNLLIEQSLDNCKTWQTFYKGKFSKVDCTWDDDSKKCEAEITTVDDYTDILASLDKEFDLIKLKPAIEAISMTRRPLIQVYCPGDNVISCFLNGTYWEQDAEIEVDTDKLVDTYYFGLCNVIKNVYLATAGDTYGEYVGKMSFESSDYMSGTLYSPYNDKYYVTVRQKMKDTSTLDNTNIEYKVFRKSDSTVLYSYKGYDVISFEMSGIGGTINANVSTLPAYARLLLDLKQYQGYTTYALPKEDITSSDTRYKYVTGLGYDLVEVGTRVIAEPTEYGKNLLGEYYTTPYSLGPTDYYPIAKSQWPNLEGFGVSPSLWFIFKTETIAIEQAGRASYTLRTAYPLSSAISVLLKELKLDITHEATAEYSDFLYGTSNIVSGNLFTLFITPKSNVKLGDYDMPAKTAKITLKQILDMLCTCFKCYWYIEDKKLKIEHILFFRNGYSYTSFPKVQLDLTKLKNPRNKKSLAFGLDKYEFDNSEIPETTTFRWMDEVTKNFGGYPLLVNNNYATKGLKVESNVELFTSDVDYIGLNPAAISNDGFVILAAEKSADKFKLPIVDVNIGPKTYALQNGYMAFTYLLPKFYVYDLPGTDVTINNESVMSVKGTKKARQQTVEFTLTKKLDNRQLIKTFLGSGQINKMSININDLQYKITLIYDTE